MDLRAVDELRVLAERDATLTARADELRRLDTEVAAIRARAESIDEFFSAYPRAEERARRASAAAEADLAMRRAEVVAAEAAFHDAKDADARAAAERAVTRARDHVEVAEARVTRAVADRDALEREAAALPAELPELAARAARVGDQQPPADAPRELVEWAARTHASLFVAAGQVDAQRERVIREANELATMLLGEPTYGATPAQARARVEAVL